MLAAVLVRLLTLSLPLPLQLGELALGAAAAAFALTSLLLLRNRWMDHSAAIVLRSIAASGIAATMIALARGEPGLDLVAVLLFTAVQLIASAQARAWALVAAALVVDVVLAVAWLLWTGGGLLTLFVVLVFMAGLQLGVFAQAKAAEAMTESRTLRSSAHAATATRVGTAIDVLGVTRAILETSREAYPLATHAFVLLHDSVADRLRPLPLYLGPRGIGPLEGDNLDFSMGSGEGMAGKAFAASRPMIWQAAADVHMAQADVSEQVRRQFDKLRHGVMLCAAAAPLIVDDEVIGVYLLTSTRQELVWDEDDLTVVSALAGEAARAIERARRYERELDQAHLDSITGLANHRQLTRTLDQEVARARRLSTTLGVVFCDLDRFKTVNDSYGHAAGDRVLTILAHVFHDLLRREDSAARYGGDEFVCVLPGADHEEAAAVGLRISSSFETRVREDPELSEAGVTISCGVAIFPDHADDVDGLLGHADAAMRLIKAGHRSELAEGSAAG